VCSLLGVPFSFLNRALLAFNLAALLFCCVIILLSRGRRCAPVFLSAASLALLAVLRLSDSTSSLIYVGVAGLIVAASWSILAGRIVWR
jgi:hypothetical protein